MSQRNTGIIDFETRKKIADAFQNGRYFITITTLSEDKKNLDHYKCWSNFKEDDLVNSLSHIAKEIDAEINSKPKAKSG